jgi:hypothetical protein
LIAIRLKKRNCCWKSWLIWLSIINMQKRAEIQAVEYHKGRWKIF